MKYFIIILTILMLFNCKNLNGYQNQHTYKTFNDIVYKITKQQKGTKILLNPKIINLKNKFSKDFFNKELINRYGKNDVIGVDSEKVKSLVANTDIEEIIIENSKENIFNDDKFNFPYQFAKTIEDDLLTKPIYRFSKPVLFNNKEYCLIYYEYYCGLDCGEGNLMIFVKKDRVWRIYTKLPIWIT